MSSILFSVFTALAMVLSALGWGGFLIRILRISGALNRVEYVIWAFAAGTGVIGWILFFPATSGLAVPWVFLAIVGLGLPGLFFLPRPLRGFSEFKDLWSAFLCAFFAALFFLDLLAAFAPQADADTTAYHLALTKQFLAAERVFFTPRAVDGAIPMLLHMTYAMALGLGGEAAVGLWSVALKWGAVAVTGVAAARFIPVRHAVLLALIFATVPAVIYGGVTGQVEVKLALLTTVAVVSLCRAIDRKDLRLVIFAGAVFGFLVAIKYTMGLVAFGAALVLVARTQSILLFLGFSVAGLVAGFQWFAFNFAASGDPVFPLLYDYLSTTVPRYWNDAQQLAFSRFVSDETAMPRSIWNAFLYPFVATLNSPQAFESDRTGFGPFCLLVLPFAAAALWQHRARLAGHALLPAAGIVLITYLLWFFFGPSQRVRHYLPLLPLLMVTMGYAAWRFRPAIRELGLFIVILTLAIQLGGAVLFNIKFVRYQLSDMGRDSFLRENVVNFALAAWINKNLGVKNIRVLHEERVLNYFLKPPYLMAHKRFSAAVEIHDAALSSRRFLSQLRLQGVTHILVEAPPGWRETSPPGLTGHLAALLRADCARVLTSIQTTAFKSRTVKGLGSTRTSYVVAALRPVAYDRCSPEN